MKAKLLFESHQLFITKTRRTVEIHMDLYEMVDTPTVPSAKFKFSWIAFDAEDPMKRVLFDSHTPKGPHFHIDEDSDGQSFNWVSVDDAILLFRKKVTDHFGELEAIPNDGGNEL